MASSLVMKLENRFCSGWIWVLDGVFLFLFLRLSVGRVLDDVFLFLFWRLLVGWVLTLDVVFW